MRLAQRAYNVEAYKSLRRKIPRETLRKRGIDYVTEPPVSLRPTWLQYVTDPQWLKIESWLELVNALARVSNSAQLDDGADGLPFVNFGIRGYRVVESDWLRSLLLGVRDVLDAVVSQPRPAGIEHVEANPFRLFLASLDQADPDRLRRCEVCGRYFYAQRRDQFACPEQCANTRRQRKYRLNRSRYEKNRRQNRQAEKIREAWRKQRKER
jgi:hypothetical protein